MVMALDKVRMAMEEAGSSMDNMVSVIIQKIYGKKFTDISFMRNLKILYAEGRYRNNTIRSNGLDLTELHADYNSTIVNVSFMRNLKILHVWKNCGISQLGINGLNFIKSMLDIIQKLQMYHLCEI